jgi:hypothetical protein
MGKFGQESYTPLQVGISASDAQVGAAKQDERLRVLAADQQQQQHYRFNSHDEDIDEVVEQCCCLGMLTAIFCCMQAGGD